MRRLQLFEFGDQRWLPWWLRDAITDHLSQIFVSPTVEPMHVAIANQLCQVLDTTNESHLLDLCSGAAGPWPAVLPLLETKLGREVSATLTDLYPNRRLTLEADTGHAGLTVESRPVDARSVPPKMGGVRTVFNSIHHFGPKQIEEVLSGATRGGHAVAIFEPFERRTALALRVAAGGIVGGWRDARAYRGGRFRTAALHLLLPIVLSWDGAVSVLRAYRAEELLAIAEGCAAGRNTDWRAERLELPWGGMTLLVGTPLNSPPKLISR